MRHNALRLKEEGNEENQACSYFLFLSPMVALAADAATFECRVISVHAVSRDCELALAPASVSSQVGATFSVNRRTGEITAAEVPANVGYEIIELSNRSFDVAFYVISRSYGAMKKVGYLYIENQRDSAQKAFTYTPAGEHVYSGYCI